MCGQVAPRDAEGKGVPRFARTHASLLRALSAVAAVLGLGWLLFVTPSAVAAVAPIEITSADPQGDARYGGVAGQAGADILSFSVTQDRATNVASGSVTFAASPSTLTPAGTHELRIGLGKVVGTKCEVWDSFGVVHIRHDLGTDIGDYVVGAMTDIRKDVPFSTTAETVSFTTPAAPDVFSGYGFRCAVVTTERLFPNRTTDADYPIDRVVAFAADDVVVPISAPVDPGKGVTAPIADADGDGVHDGIDKCPKVPGAALNGCENVPLATSIKLGTKRVVIDRLLATTAGTCPKTVKVVVKLSGKTLGKQNVGTLKKGRFCHVQAVVTLKKKVKKARVTIAGTGVTSVGATVAK